MSNLQKTLVDLAKTIDKNKTRGYFGHARFRGVPWLDKFPETPEEIAANLAMMLEAGGFDLVFDAEKIDKEKMGRFIANAVALQKQN